MISYVCKGSFEKESCLQYSSIISETASKHIYIPQHPISVRRESQMTMIFFVRSIRYHAKPTDAPKSIDSTDELLHYRDVIDLFSIHAEIMLFIIIFNYLLIYHIIELCLERRLRTRSIKTTDCRLDSKFFMFRTEIDYLIKYN
jgi:hypothetical protein